MEEIINKEFLLKIVEELKFDDESVNSHFGFILENEIDDMFDLMLFCLHITKSLAENSLSITKRFPFETNFPSNVLFNEHLENLYTEILKNKLEMMENFKDLTNE